MKKTLLCLVFALFTLWCYGFWMTFLSVDVPLTNTARVQEIVAESHTTPPDIKIGDIYGDELPCDGVGRPVPSSTQGFWWGNTTGQRIFVHNVYMFVGVTYGYRGDILVNLYHTTATSNLVKGKDSWDHYAEPSNWHRLEFDYRPGALWMEPNEYLTLWQRCSPSFVPIVFNGKPIAPTYVITGTIHYTLE